MSVYIVNGAPGSGKTTFESEISAILGYRAAIYSTVSFVKEVAKSYGWDGEKEEKDRKFLSDLKDCLTEWNDIPFKKTIQFYNKYKNCCESFGIEEDEWVLFIDCREPKEIKRLCEALGAKSLYIRRKEAEDKPASNHADAEVKDYKYDIIIDNNGSLEDLINNAIIFLKDQKIKGVNK